MAQAGTVWVDVRGDTTGLIADMRRAAGDSQAALAGLGAGRAVVAGLATAAGVAATSIVALGVSAVKASTDFGKAVSGVGAVANATAGELEALRQAALQAGADTAFSASEAAVAEAELAKAGVSVSDILGGGLAGSLGLAAAGQIELGDAATISAQALNIFGLAGDQTSHVADVLAAGANKSAADVGQLGQAMQQSGLVAAQLGIGFEDAIGTLSLFADNALLGSDAGTSFRTMLQRLVPQSAEQTAAMADLGLSFFDAQGQFVGLAETAGRIQSAMSGLTQEQRAAAMTTIFGSDAVRASSLLYEAGADGVREYTDAVNDQGAASRMAKAQMDNLAGDVDTLRGSWETLLISLGTRADGGLRSLTQGATEFVNSLTAAADSPAFDAIETKLRRILGGAGRELAGFGTEIADFFAGLTASDVDQFFNDVAASIDRVAGPLAGLTASFGSLGASKLSFGLIPGLPPLQAALAGVVLQSDEGREALAQLGKTAATVTTSAAPALNLFADALGFVADQGWLVQAALDAFVAFKFVEIVTPWARAARDFGGSLRTLWQDLAEQGAAARLGETLQQSAVSAGAATASMSGFGAGAATAGTSAAGAAVGVSTLAAAMMAVEGQQLGLAAGAFTIDPDVIDVPSWEVFDQAASRAAITAGGLGEAAETAGGAMGGLGKRTGDVARGGVSALGTAVSGLTSLIAGPAGITAALTAGTLVYQAWSDAKGKAKTASEEFSAALREENGLLNANTGGAIRSNLKRLEVDDDFDRAGLSLKKVFDEINSRPGELDQFRAAFQAVGEDFGSIEDAARNASVDVPRYVTLIAQAVEDGLIKDVDGREIINALTDIDKGAKNAADGVAAEFRAMQVELSKTQGVSERTMIEIARDFNALPSTGRQQFLDDLIDQYPRVADAAGVVASETKKADTATTSAGGAMDDAATSGQDLVTTYNDVAGAADNAATSALKLLDLQDADSDAQKRVADARKKLAEIESGSSEALTTAREALVDADTQLTKAIQDNARQTADALRDLEDKRAKLEAAREKGAATALGGEDRAGGREVDLSVIRDIESAQRDVAEAEKKYQDLASGNSDQIVSAKDRVADAQRRVAEETAKVGPESDAARDATEDLDDAQRAAAGAAIAVADALAASTGDAIPAQIAALDALRTQYGLNKTEVDQLIGSLLVKAALEAQTPVPTTTPTTPTTSAGETARPGFRNADRNEFSPNGSTVLSEVVGKQRGLGFAPYDTTADDGSEWKWDSKNRVWRLVGPGRAAGGPVDAARFFPVNELGSPELFTDRSGGQFLLPTEGGGQVQPLSAGSGTGRLEQLLSAVADELAQLNARPATVTIGEITMQGITDRNVYRETARALADARYAPTT